jgi:hypothetical protein
MDDWCLSGMNLCNIVDSFVYGNKNLSKKKVNIKVLMHILSDVCISNISEIIFPDNISIEISGNIHVSEFRPVKPDDMDEEAFEMMKEDFLEEFNPDTKAFGCALHLEYKLANQFGGFPLIYEACRSDIVKQYRSYQVSEQELEGDICLI